MEKATVVVEEAADVVEEAAVVVEETSDRGDDDDDKNETDDKNDEYDNCKTKNSSNDKDNVPVIRWHIAAERSIQIDHGTIF